MKMKLFAVLFLMQFTSLQFANAGGFFTVNPERISFWIQNESNPFVTKKLWASIYEADGKFIQSFLLTGFYKEVGFKKDAAETKTTCDLVKLNAQKDNKKIRVAVNTLHWASEVICAVSDEAKD